MYIRVHIHIWRSHITHLCKLSGLNHQCRIKRAKLQCLVLKGLLSYQMIAVVIVDVAVAVVVVVVAARYLLRHSKGQLNIIQEACLHTLHTYLLLDVCKINSWAQKPNQPKTECKRESKRKQIFIVKSQDMFRVSRRFEFVAGTPHFWVSRWIGMQRIIRVLHLDFCVCKTLYCLRKRDPTI